MRRDVCIGMPGVGQQYLCLCFHMVTVSSRNKPGGEMLDFFSFPEKQKKLLDLQVFPSSFLNSF